MRTLRISAAATTLTSVAFQVSLAVWPDVLRNYAWIVKYLWIGAGILWLVTIALFLRDVFGNKREIETSTLRQETKGLHSPASSTSGAQSPITNIGSVIIGQLPTPAPLRIQYNFEERQKRKEISQSIEDLLGEADRIKKDCCDKEERHEILRAFTRWGADAVSYLNSIDPSYVDRWRAAPEKSYAMSGRKKHESLWSVVHSHAKVLEKILEELRDEAPQATEVVRQNDSLQGHVPRIVPVEHGITKPGQWRGLIIANDGEPAYSISFPSVQVARSKMVFTRGISRLAKEDGKIHCEYWIEQEPGSGSPGGLFEEMVRQNIDAIELPIRYKDGGNQWYETTVKLERDVMAPTGIQAEYVAQKKITQPA